MGISLVAQAVKNLPAMRDTQVWSLGREAPLERGMTTYSSILAWRIPQTEGPGGLWSTGSQRFGHDRATGASAFSHPSEHTWRGLQSGLAGRSGLANADMGTLIWPWHHHPSHRRDWTCRSTPLTPISHFIIITLYFYLLLYSDSLHRCKTHELRSHACVGKKYMIDT